MNPLRDDQVVHTILAAYNRVKTYRPHLSEEVRRNVVRKNMLKDYGVTVTSQEMVNIFGPIAETRNPILLQQNQPAVQNMRLNRKRSNVDTNRNHITSSTPTHSPPNGYNFKKFRENDYAELSSGSECYHPHCDSGQYLKSYFVRERAKMIHLSSDQVVPAMRTTYHRIKTYRPHLSEEVRRSLVKKNMLENHGINVSPEEMINIFGPLQQCVKKKMTNKKPIRSGQNTSDQLNKKRDFLNMTIDDENHMKTSTPTHRFSINYNAEELRTKSNAAKSNNVREIYEKLISMSKIPRPVFRFTAVTNNDSSSQQKNIFNRFYEAKPLGSYIKRNASQKSKKSCLPTKIQSQNTINMPQEPPTKRGRYSSICLSDRSRTSVFERLYSQRKQLNTKQLTDREKREIYLKQEREKFKKAQQEQRTFKVYHDTCNSGYSSSTASATSDFDMNEFRESDGELSSDSLGTTMTESNIGITKDETLPVDKNEMINSFLDEDNPPQKNSNILNSLRVSFKQQLSLCQINEKDLCNSGCSSPTASATSDFDMNKFRERDGELSSDSLETTMTKPNVGTTNNETLPLDKNELFYSLSDKDNSPQKNSNILNSLTENIKQQWSLYQTNKKYLCNSGYSSSTAHATSDFDMNKFRESDGELGSDSLEATITEPNVSITKDETSPIDTNEMNYLFFDRGNTLQKINNILNNITVYLEQQSYLRQINGQYLCSSVYSYSTASATRYFEWNKFRESYGDKMTYSLLDDNSIQKLKDIINGLQVYFQQQLYLRQIEQQDLCNSVYSYSTVSATSYFNMNKFRESYGESGSDSMETTMTQPNVGITKDETSPLDINEMNYSLLDKNNTVRKITDLLIYLKVYFNQQLILLQFDKPCLYHFHSTFLNDMPLQRLNDILNKLKVYFEQLHLYQIDEKNLHRWD